MGQWRRWRRAGVPVSAPRGRDLEPRHPGRSVPARGSLLSAPGNAEQGQDRELLARWQQRASGLVARLGSFVENLASNLKDEVGRKRFEDLTKIDASEIDDPNSWRPLRQRIEKIQREIQRKQQLVEQASEKRCGEPPPPPPPPPAPPVDPTAGLVAPVYEAVGTQSVPDGPLCSNEEKTAIIDAVEADRQKAADNAVKASHFRVDISQALNAGQGDAATLQKLHAQASADLEHWDAESARLGLLWRKALALGIIDCTQPSTTGAGPLGNVPSFLLGLNGGYLGQQLPAHNAQLGVIDVGGEEKDLLHSDTSVHGWTVGASGLVLNLGPKLGAIDSHLYLEGFYGQAKSDGSKDVAPEVGVSNGISYWEQTDGTNGIASTGAGLSGQTNFKYQTFELRLGVKRRLPCGDDEDWDDEDGPPPRILSIRGLGYDRSVLAPAEPAQTAIPGATDADGIRYYSPGFEGFRFPATYVEGGFQLGYARQSFDQNANLNNPNPAFAAFNVDSETHGDISDWGFLGTAGLRHIRAVPGVEGLFATFGADIGLGYRDSSANGREHNLCDVRFAATPGVNSCAPALQDFMLQRHPDAGGFAYELDTSVRLDYRLDSLVPGLSVGVGYDFGWGGVSRFDTPKNLSVDGPPDRQWSYQPRHQFNLNATIFH